MTILLLVIIHICLLYGFIVGNDQIGNNENEEIKTNIEDEVSLIVEHSFDSYNFKPRSQFKVVLKYGATGTSLDAEENGIAVADSESFKSLISKNGYYSIRVHTQLGNNTSPYVKASIPVCELQKSGFKEDIAIHLDVSLNHVIGLSYSSPILAMPRECDANKIINNQRFLSRVKIAERTKAQVIPLQVLGPRPPQLQNVRLGLEEEKAAQNPQNQPFLIKYWYLVLPMFIILFLPGKDDPKVKKN